ncbi:MAG: phosphatidylserine decarboxylase [Oscillospiraceae bacterium]|nr:phosphatidylserine decarboxylase [Oscillospiraceae bacterium]
MDTLEFLYGTAPGRLLLKPLASRRLSRLGGRLLETRASRLLIEPFARYNHIDCGDYELSDISCFNDFFCRPLKPGRRSFCAEPEALAAPCDGLLTVHRIHGGLVLAVKQSRYTVGSLLRDRALAARFAGGLCLVYRLCVDNYHRYCYFDGGEKSPDRFIPGVLHTVRPVALARRPVFIENCRSYTVLETVNFGAAVQMEVGAMLVGRIVNRHPEARHVARGEEKGRFAYGGSTIIVLLEKDAAVPRDDILEASAAGRETPVRLGEAVGRRGQIFPPQN